MFSVIGYLCPIMETGSKKIFSLFQLLESVERMIEKTYANHYWIRADMIKLNRYQQQHCYPEFVEKKGDEIIADIRGIIWSSTFDAINERFQSVVGEPLKDGMKVVMLVKLNFTPKRGFSLLILDIDPTFTLGDMLVQKAKVIEKLTSEGIMHKNKLLATPILPRHIAIISVSSSKGYQDFINVLDNFSERYRPHCILYTAVLQGDKAVDSIMTAFQNIKKFHQLFDFVVLIRGGGSEVGLTCYDDYNLAAEIANFPIPVLTGIGHSTNETVAEMVAWKNLITPTETAYHIIDYFKHFEKEIHSLAKNISYFAENQLIQESEKIQQWAAKLKWRTEKLINIHRENIVNQQHNLQFCSELITVSKKNKLNFTILQFQKLPQLIFQKYRHQLEISILKIQLYDPKKTLQKGFSLTRKAGKTVSSVDNVKKGDVLITEVRDGFIESVVTS